MNPQSEPSSPVLAANPKSDGPAPGRGRPRALDDAKRREICALLAGGCGLREAARYVRCSTITIRREAERNSEFREQLRRSETYAQLSPLRAMQHAVGTHWRAAAWMLERAFPERFARPEPGAFGARQARQLLDEVLHIIHSEMIDPLKVSRIEKRIRITFEYNIRANCDRRRTTRNLRRAIAFFEEKDRLDDPFQSGFPTPDFDELFKAYAPMPSPQSSGPDKQNSTPASSTPNRGPAESAPPKPATAVASADKLVDVLEDLVDKFAAGKLKPPPKPAQPRPQSVPTGAHAAPNNP